MNMMKAISLGWGTQSFGLAAMSALGILPPVDVAIHADTTHERRETYEFAARWTPWLEEHGVRVVTVENPRKGIIENWTATGIMIAAYTTYEDGRASGILRRQCTHDWKIMPIRRWLQVNRDGQPVEMWIGISLDELERSRISDVLYIKNVYPYLEFNISLVGGTRYGLRRSDIVHWLQANDLEVPVKSACVFCPYHDRRTWREIQLASNGDWEKAVQVDEAIRHKCPGYTCYLTSARKPLADCNFRSQEEQGQMTLWEAEECQGMCFL